MNNLTKKGSIEVVAVAGLSILLVAVLGWIFWQNYTEKSSDKNDTQTTVSHEKSTEHDSMAMLHLDEFGMMVPLEGNSDGFSAKYIEDEAGERYAIFSKRSTEKCGYEAGLGVVTKMVPTDDGTAPSSALANAAASVTIDDVDYLFVPPQNACADPSTSEGKEANQLFNDLLTKFAKMFEKAHNL